MGIWPDVFPLDTGLGSGGLKAEMPDGWVRDGVDMFPRTTLESREGPNLPKSGAVTTVPSFLTGALKERALNQNL